MLPNKSWPKDKIFYGLRQAERAGPRDGSGMRAAQRAHNNEQPAANDHQESSGGSSIKLINDT